MISTQRYPLVSHEDLETYESSIESGASALRTALPEGFSPAVLLTLGSNLGDLSSQIECATSVAFAEIPYLASSTAPGHRGRFIAGTLAGVPVLCMQGRLHPYEGLSPLEVTRPLHIAHALGARTLIATNASGAINTSYSPGQIVAIADHINLTGMNPLIGINDDAQGPRFPDMSRAYTPALRTLAQRAGKSLGYDIPEGVYLGLLGPSFETPAEIRAFRALGADLVGMSTVWEVIVAAWLGMDVLGLSMVTNMAAGILETPISTEDIDRASQAGAAEMGDLLKEILAQL